jgi:hypothetical protein
MSLPVEQCLFVTSSEVFTQRSRKFTYVFAFEMGSKPEAPPVDYLFNLPRQDRFVNIMPSLSPT